MPGDQSATHPTGLRIDFLEGPHTYTDSNGQSYESGTSFVKRFKPEFDKDGEILKRTAEKRGVSPEALKAEWTHKAEQASAYGTRCHENAEYQFKKQFNKIHRAITPKEEIAFRVIWDYVQTLQSKYTFVATEQIVFSPRYAIAGSIDLLMSDPGNRTLWIIDWKSNKKIDMQNNFGGRMLGPLSHLHDCSFVHYSLQLHTYQRLIEDEGYMAAAGMSGYKIRKVLLWIPPMGEAIEPIECQDMSREVSEMLISKAYDLPF